ncbi:5-oxoprolinase (hydantoinase B/oxoprolinase) [Seiridium cupressi]
MGSVQAASVFANATFVPPDAIFDVTRRYIADESPDKMNLGQGTYRDENGKPWILPSVRVAEEKLRPNIDHEYLPIAGLQAFREEAVKLVFHGSKPLSEERIASCQSLSGTGALLLAGLALKQANAGITTVFITEPTWSNHDLLFSRLGFQVKQLPYYKKGAFDFENFLNALKTADSTCAVVLHACAHNPTGCDPSRDQWKEIAAVVEERGIFPIFDSAYLGFNSGSVDEDAWAIRYFTGDLGLEASVCLSFAKNMGLYGERTGLVTFVARTTSATRTMASILENVQRATVSSPAAYGAKVAATVLGTPSAKEQWAKDLITMSGRIISMRQKVFDELVKLGTPGDWSHLIKQSGMFGYTGISPAQVRYLEAGLNESNVAYFARALDDAVSLVRYWLAPDKIRASQRVEGVDLELHVASFHTLLLLHLTALLFTRKLTGATWPDMLQWTRASHGVPCVASVPGQDDILIKLLSVDPSNYRDAPVEAIRRVLEKATGKSYPRDQKISLEGVESIKMGTTVATNALLERKGERTAFVVTKGLKDLLHIGQQSRPKLFDLTISKPDVLYAKVVEVPERVTLEAWTERKTPLPIDVHSDPTLVEGVTGEVVRILEPIGEQQKQFRLPLRSHPLRATDLETTRKLLQKVYDEGFRSVAICLMHSYTFRDHEQAVKKLAEEIGFTHISSSAELSPTVKIVPRGNSSTADAYLTPEIKRYIEGFESGFADLSTSGCRCEFMQSDGGLVEFSGLSGLRAILSGPAGGCVGYARTAYDHEDKTPVIGFDMGGTSTDVSRFAGRLEQVFETTTAGVTVQSPQLDINTVAAGGGSILTWEAGMFKVGPESASAHPGPACYRKGGPLTVTDANLILGRLRPEFFPKVFGPNEDLPLDINASRVLFEDMTKKINEEIPVKLTLEEVAAGFLDVANEAMCRPIRTLTEAKGFDVSRHNLASFGGAGGQHACDIARKLGVSRVLIHKYSSLLSAYGMALADVVHEERSPCALIYSEDKLPTFSSELDKLQDKATQILAKQRISKSRITAERYLNMRFQGSDTPLMIQETSKPGGFLEEFRQVHQQEFGFLPIDRDVIIDDYRVRCIGASTVDVEKPWKSELASVTPTQIESASASESKDLYFKELGWSQSPMFNLADLVPGSKISGPALIMDSKQTIVVTPGSKATILTNNVVIDIDVVKKEQLSSKEADPIQLSIFGHRFMGVAEQAGRALQKTSVSTNIKERLDFSCTVFSPKGALVANAPHVPAMIGSMAFAVKWQIEHWKGDLRPGDVILSNSPVCGGVHLPDMTVITPVFDAEGKNIIFWTASRGHHADVGGILPGSMPPSSKELWEEGAVIRSFKVIEGGVFKEQELTDLLMAPGKIPGVSGTRCLRDNISDIKAQAAANHRGSQLIHGLIADYGLEVVQFYMGEIIGAAELTVRDMLKRIHKQTNGKPLRAVDFMDDGTPIELCVTIDEKTGGATFDFEGTGPEAYGNWNAPIAICNSAILFALRCMVNIEIPLNQGAIQPIQVLIPDNSLLKPSEEAAVCAGNVLTSQRIVDVIFKAFNVVAASQGCMNNLTFGTDDPENGFGYYETICGGAGGGPTWDGVSGVHTNMTNTRITDPEILERRYPVILRQFCLRPGSGGAGAHPGGDGIIRDIEVSLPIKVSILSERRAFAPYGLEGGEDGKRGLNLWVKKNGRVINLGGKNTANMNAGDRMVVQSPGGGGWGKLAEGTNKDLVSGLTSTIKNTFQGVANGTVGILQSMGESA